mgnify:CR=1 FL=1
MLESKKIHILGYSGHAYVVIDTAISNGDYVKSYFDKEDLKFNPYNLIYSGFEDFENLCSIIKSDFVFPAVGSNILRKKMITLIELLKLKQTKLVHKTASVSISSKINISTLVAPRAIINSLVVVGKGVIINSGAIVEHECVIGDFSHVAPAAVLAGNVKLGNHSFIGANATVKEGVSIGNNVVIGAGSVVIKNINNNETWVGNPARRIK